MKSAGIFMIDYNTLISDGIQRWEPYFQYVGIMILDEITCVNRPILLNRTSSVLSVSLTALLLVIDVVWVLVSPLSFDWGSIGIGLAVPAVLLLYAAFYTFIRPAERISSMSVDAAILILFSHVGCVFGYLIATSPMPLQDELFLGIDQFLGFDWIAYSSLVV